MALGSILRCMCNYGFCFEAYISMTVFVACFDFRIFGCMHNKIKLMILSWRQWRSQGGKGDICPRAQHFQGVNWGWNGT